MNEPDPAAAKTAFLEKVMRYQDGAMSAEEIVLFENELRDDAANRRVFAEAQLRSMALHERFRQDAFRVVPQVKRSAWVTSLVSRPLAAAAGLVFGLFCATVAWAVASPRAVATMARVFALADGSFEGMSGKVPSGFPQQSGVWSGDDAEVVNADAVKAKEGARMLRFIAPGADANDPDSRAISCDVFQFVDLRPLRATFSAEGDAVLELSASFLDARAHNSKPSVTFSCQMYLFRGDPAAMHQTWPLNLAEALSSSTAQVTTLGSDGKGWCTLGAKCLVPAEADFAVVQIAARPNLRPAKLELLFADDVRLTLKTSPVLPVRIVQR